MKKIFTFMLVFLLAVGAWADDGVWVVCQDGTKQGFLFADKPTITYESENLVLKTTTATAQFPIADIKQLYFADDVVNSIDAMKTDAADKVIRAVNGGAELSGFAADTPVTVYDLNAKVLQQLKVASDGTLTVSLISQPQGVYVIKAEKSIIKIQNK